MTSSLERYLSHLRTGRRLAANTLGAYARDGALLAALSAGREPSGITSQDIRRFIAMLHGKGLSPRSLARVLSSWRGFFEWLMRRHEITANPCGGVRAPKGAKTARYALPTRWCAWSTTIPYGPATLIFELAY
jgi:integrase/recombinase XerC